jgi:hypothetical protein
VTPGLRFPDRVHAGPRSPGGTGFGGRASGTDPPANFPTALTRALGRCVTALFGPLVWRRRLGSPPDGEVLRRYSSNPLRGTAEIELTGRLPSGINNLRGSLEGVLS